MIQLLDCYRRAEIAPGPVIGTVPPGAIVRGNPAVVVGER